MAWPLLSTEPIMQYRNRISPDSIANIRKIFQFPMLSIKKLEKSWKFEKLYGRQQNYIEIFTRKGDTLTHCR